MRRSLLTGMLLGSALTLASALGAQAWSASREEPLYLRIADDDHDDLAQTDRKAEDSPTSARLIRACGIDKFSLDLAIPDHEGSAFVEIDSTPRPRLNCLIGEARIHGLSLAVVRGLDTAAFECLPGWPSRFRKLDAADYQFCPHGRPNEIIPRTQRPAAGASRP